MIASLIAGVIEVLALALVIFVTLYLICSICIAVQYVCIAVQYVASRINKYRKIKGQL